MYRTAVCTSMYMLHRNTNHRGLYSSAAVHERITYIVYAPISITSVYTGTLLYMCFSLGSRPPCNTVFVNVNLCGRVGPGNSEFTRRLHTIRLRHNRYGVWGKPGTEANVLCML